MGLLPAGGSPDIVRSGHIEYDTLYASNEVQVRTCVFVVNPYLRITFYTNFLGLL